MGQEIVTESGETCMVLTDDVTGETAIFFGADIFEVSAASYKDGWRRRVGKWVHDSQGG